MSNLIGMQEFGSTPKQLYHSIAPLSLKEKLQRIRDNKQAKIDSTKKKSVSVGLLPLKSIFAKVHNANSK